MWEWNTDALLVIVTTAGVLVATLTIIVDRVLAHEARQTDLFMQLYDRLDDSDFQASWSEVYYNWKWDSVADFFDKYGPAKNIESWSRGISVAHYFEGIGVLVEKKMIDIELVTDLMSTNIKWFWEKMGQVTKEMRQVTNDPHLWENLEYLYGEIDKREKQKAKKTQKSTASA